MPASEGTDVLSCLADPEHSLASIADRHGTTIHALTRWMAMPEIAARLDDLERASARMLRLQVADNLPHVAGCLVDIVRDTQVELNHVPLNPANLRHIEQRTRTRETARKACTLLVRLARFTGGPAPERKPGAVAAWVNAPAPTSPPLPVPW